MNMLFDNWKFADNHKAKIRSWIADVVEGRPITELHNKGFSLSSVNEFVSEIKQLSFSLHRLLVVLETVLCL